MLLDVRVQESLAVAHLAQDDGDFIFVLCRAGFERALGRETHTGEKVRVNATVREVKTHA